MAGFARRWTVVLLAAAFGTGWLVGGAAARQREGAAEEAAGAAARARVAAAQRGYEQAREEWRRATRRSGGTLYTWSRRLLDAQRAARPQPAEQVAAFRAHRDRMRELARSQDRAAAAGVVPGVLVIELDYYRAEADAWHAEAAAGRLPPAVP